MREGGEGGCINEGVGLVQPQQRGPGGASPACVQVEWDVVVCIDQGVGPLTLLHLAYAQRGGGLDVTSRQGHSLDVSLVIDLQGQNKKTRVLSASYKE